MRLLPIVAAALVLGAAAPLAAQPPVPAGPAQPTQPSQPAEPSRPAPVSGREIQVVQSSGRTLPGPTREQLRTLRPALRLPGENDVVVRTGIPYRVVDGDTLLFDLYLPAGEKRPRAAVIFVTPASDARDWPMMRGYGRLAAAQGLAAVVYAKRYERSEVLPGAIDTGALLDHVVQNAAALGVDPARLALWAFGTGGRLLATGMDVRRPEVRAIVGFYPVLDLSDELPLYPDSLRFRVRTLASPVHALQDRPTVVPPTLLVRAVLDEPMLNSGIDRFVHFALEADRPIELINVPGAGRGFDLLNDREDTRRVIRRAFEFVMEQLSGTP